MREFQKKGIWLVGCGERKDIKKVAFALYIKELEEYC